MFEPYEFQEEAIEKSFHNYILADKCGLGKTLVAIEAIKRDRMGPVLYVTRKNAKYQVVNFILEQDPGIPVYTVENDKSYPIGEVFPEYQMYIVTHYEALPGLIKRTDAAKIYWDWVIADESHKIKNRNAKRTRALKRFMSRRRLALSATPTNKHFKVQGVNVPSPSELWSQLNWLEPQIFTSYWKFHEDFVISKKHFLGYMEDKGIRNPEGYFTVLDRYMLQRTKKEVAPWLPPVTSVTVDLPLKGKQKSLYRQLVALAKEDILVEVEDMTPLVITNKLSLLTHLQKLTSYPPHFEVEIPGIKIGWVEEFLEDSDESTLIFTRFRATAIYIARKFGLPLIIGGQNEVGSAQHPRIVATIGAAGESLDMPWIDSVIFVDQVWSSIQMEQGRDRVYRMNIKSPKTFYYLRCPETVDDLVYYAFMENWPEPELLKELIKHVLEKS